MFGVNLIFMIGVVLFVFGFCSLDVFVIVYGIFVMGVMMIMIIMVFEFVCK